MDRAHQTDALHISRTPLLRVGDDDDDGDAQLISYRMSKHAAPCICQCFLDRSVLPPSNARGRELRSSSYAQSQQYDTVPYERTVRCDGVLNLCTNREQGYGLSAIGIEAR